MSAAQRYNQPTAFSTTSSPHRPPVRTGTGAERGRETARGGVPSPGPARSVRRAAAPSRSRGETVQLFLMVCCAGFCAMAGFAYLSCYVMLTNEGYRHAKLSSQVLQETQKRQRWTHQQALVSTPDNIEKQAKNLNMVRPDEKLTITVR